MKDNIPIRLRQGTFRKSVGRITCKALPGALLAVFLTSFSVAASHSAASWKGYTSRDGLRESYCAVITACPSGRVVVVHGQVDRASLLDGYKIIQIPTPVGEMKIRESPEGELWALSPAGPPVSMGLHEGVYLGGLQRFVESQSRWEVYPIAELQGKSLQQSDHFVPLGGGKVAIVLENRVLEFDRPSRQIRTLLPASETALGIFTCAEAALGGGLWVSGTHGVGRLRPNGNPKWMELHPNPSLGELRDFMDVREVLPEQFFVTAAGPSPQKSTLLRYRSGTWERIASGSREEALTGWDTPEGGYWLVEGAEEYFSLSHIFGSRKMTEERIKPLTGAFMHASASADGSFWIATQSAAARYTPAAWRTPACLEDKAVAVSAGVGGPDGRVFFLSYDRILALDPEGKSREEFPLPKGCRADAALPQGMVLLPDGRITVPILDSNSILMFHPASGTFEMVPHPWAERMIVMGSGKDGSLWISAYRREHSFELQSYDGKEFRTVLNRGSQWHMSHLRAVLEAADGTIWVGGPGGSGLARYRNGNYEAMGPAEGYIGGGAYTILELDHGRILFGDQTHLQVLDGKSWETVQTDTETVRSASRSRDGSLWIASGSGLHRCRDGSWVSLDTRDGIPDGAMQTVFEDRQGRIWAGGSRGIVRYFPDADRDPPETILNESDNLKETPPGGDIRIVFTGMDRWHMTGKDRLLYSYRLDAGPWTMFHPQPYSSFSRLAPGQHQIEVRAMDRNFNVDPHPARLNFLVLRAWYREPGFLAIVLIAAAGTGILAGLHGRNHRRLGILVAERTRDLTTSNELLRQEIQERARTAEERDRLEHQLLQAQKMEAIGRLSGGIAHDFNNLLTVINGYCDLLLHRLKPQDPSVHSLVEIQKAGEKAAALTQQLLAFSRKQVLQPRILDLNTVVKDTEKMLRRLIGEDIRLVVHLHAEPVTVLVDHGQIVQVLMNLAGNARDAMPRGGSLILETGHCELDADYARTEPDVKPGHYVFLAVSDTGTGMDEPTKVRIFEPFFTTKERGRGTGLGLATVHGIVAQSGGHIHVYSEPDRGATFKIYFPRLDAAPELLPEPTRTPVLQGNGSLLLLVEDQPEVRRVTSTALQGFGYRTLEAGSGEEALRLWEERGTEVVALVTDVVLPGMSGRDLAEILKSRQPHLAVLYMSGYTANVVVHHGVLDSGVAFLQKPFSPDALGRKLQELLCGTDAHPQPGTDRNDT